MLRIFNYVNDNRFLWSFQTSCLHVIYEVKSVDVSSIKSNSVIELGVVIDTSTITIREFNVSMILYIKLKVNGIVHLLLVISCIWYFMKYITRLYSFQICIRFRIVLVLIEMYFTTTKKYIKWILEMDFSTTFN